MAGGRQNAWAERRRAQTKGAARQAAQPAWLAEAPAAQPFGPILLPLIVTVVTRTPKKISIITIVVYVRKIQP